MEYGWIVGEEQQTDMYTEKSTLLQAHPLTKCLHYSMNISSYISTPSSIINITVIFFSVVFYPVYLVYLVYLNANITNITTAKL